ncbi:MAG TPA: MFS transporter, partial [Rubricoccaceae bacterium]
MPASDHPTGRPAALGFILLAVLLDVLGIGLIIPVLPAVVAELNVGTGFAPATVYGWLVGTYALAQFVCAPLVGALSDRFGRRPVLLVSMATLGINFVGTYFAPTLGWLFATRVLSGATAANVTAANAYVADVSGPEDRARNFGRVGAMFGLGFVVGPAVGGFLGETDPRAPFLLAAGLCAFNVLYGVFVLPESLPRALRRPLDLRRVNPVGALAALRRYPAVSGLALTFGLAALAQVALQTTWVLDTGERFGWGPQANGLSLMAVGVLTAGVQGGLVGRLTA